MLKATEMYYLSSTLTKDEMTTKKKSKMISLKKFVKNLIKFNSNLRGYKGFSKKVGK